MFRTLLIANRGEIACRIIATARRLGLRTVAVASDADRAARHVRLADEVVHIGPAPAAASYLDVPRLVDAARRSGAAAVHPGYGFLAEHAGFAEACAAAGLVFVGPSADAIRRMGSKSAARALAEAAGVPVTPGYHGDAQDDAVLRAEAARLGWPLMIKAVAGGGGRGLRRVDDAAGFDAALAACRREAEAAFGDGRVLLERCVERARHVEVQVFGDALRGRLHAAALAVARAVHYVGAGTVEFLLAPDGGFHFMEMNTRLQVEHPVTETITGLDLVEWQLRVAAGEPLPLAQEAIRADGHAMEARLCAEDPAAGFRPAGGRLTHLHLPAADGVLRVDSGYERGDTVPTHYDSLLAKLVARGAGREEARRRLLDAVAATRVVGVTTNREFLHRLLACPDFATAVLDTGLVARGQDTLLAAPGPAPPATLALLAVASLADEAAAAAREGWRSPWQDGAGWRLNAPARRRLRFREGGRAVTLTVTDGGVVETAGGRLPAEVHGRDPEGGVVAEVGGEAVTAVVVRDGDDWHVFAGGRHDVLATDDPLAHAGDAAVDAGGLAAPMPGTVTALLAAPGDVVAAGTPLLVLEAMKMEHAVCAPATGAVVAYRCAEGEQVAEGAELVEFRPSAG